MAKTSLCGARCDECQMVAQCNGCTATGGKPFGGECVLADCITQSNLSGCADCSFVCTKKQSIIDEFNALSLADLPKITELFALSGAYVNMEYTLKNGQKVKLLDDRNVYLCNQIEKKDGKCYGLAADNNYLLVCEYGLNGDSPQIIVYKKRK